MSILLWGLQQLCWGGGALARNNTLVFAALPSSTCVGCNRNVICAFASRSCRLLPCSDAASSSTSHAHALLAGYALQALGLAWPSSGCRGAWCPSPCLSCRQSCARGTPLLSNAVSCSVSTMHLSAPNCVAAATMQRVGLGSLHMLYSCAVRHRLWLCRGCV